MEFIGENRGIPLARAKRCHGYIGDIQLILIV